MSDTLERPSPNRVRQSYRRPVLTAYGQLKDLTAGGSGTANETSNGKKPRP